MISRSPFALVIAIVCCLGATPLLATTFTVNSPSDVNDASAGNGICETAPGNGVCTLRAAIQEANALPGSDIINLPALPAPNAYVLVLAPELVISSTLTINGGGAATTIIDGNRNVRQNSGVLSIPEPGSATINAVTIRNGGRGIGSYSAGGIHNVGTLNLTSSTVSGNSTVNQSGGIQNNGTLTLVSSTVSGNSTIGAGGGIVSFSPLTMVNSTVSGNTAETGGGFYLSSGTLYVANSTISGNQAGFFGAGVYIGAGTMELFNVTIANNLGNLAETMSAGSSGAGVINDLGMFSLQNAVILGNFDSAGLLGQLPSDCLGLATSNGNNVLGTPVLAGCTITGGGVTFVSFLNGPYVGPLQDNGGPTYTHALLANNPALNGGHPLGCRDQFGALLTTDQRGFSRPSGANCDAGAFEVQDIDGDGVDDSVDNCVTLANASQCDSDGDGYGNRCDGDLNDNSFTNAQDTTLFRQQLGQPSVGPTFNEADLNCNGFVNAQDTTLFRGLLGSAPGPSAFVP